ncbi:sigma 54-interacting transcriptional regulator [Paenibacillus sp. N1-5-1-14]|uniref:sigma-54 interaction domain-containing protein n=1 Tax=Paenibacillus radicibacter TaxID=2972488 RepID=UPI0021593D59|nr:sigma 54-interacting transcriptional regulator [Paenibacillus radicibacter]MCR8644763.1 sigma 54-interacting transcriptional regulator [Paenibacillus radicibacter]
MKHKLPQIIDLLRTNFTYTADKKLKQPFNPPVLGSKGSLQTSAEIHFYKHGDQVYSYNDTAWQPIASACVTDPIKSIIQCFHENVYIFIQDEAGNPLGYLITSDLMDALFQSHQRLEAFFEGMIETMDASISMIDEDERTIVWTKGAEDIFSIKAKDILGKPISDFFPIHMLQTLRALQTGDSVFRKQHQPRPDLYVLINSNPIMLDGKIIGSIAAEKDITSEVRLNQELFNATAKVHHLQQQMAQLMPSSDPFIHIKGTSRAIKHAIEMSSKVGSTKATVLVLGESGVGKELFAKAIHDTREKIDAPFIAINCGAIPPSLFESELFGYEKGAFSGADHNGKKGKIELAKGGTLFLDEIGEMPLDMQVKLLRVLQERKYYPVGGTKQLEADFRVVAATNRDLEQLVKKGLFREDLYYRLNVVTVDIPPLRERKEDIIELTQYFLYEFAISYNRLIQGLPQEVMLDLMQYDWPGNIRELRNTVERLVVFAADGLVKREYLPQSIYTRKKSEDYEEPVLIPSAVGSLQKEMETHEKQIILKALDLEKGNKQAAAKRLGMSRATLYNKMNKLGLIE